MSDFAAALAKLLEHEPIRNVWLDVPEAQVYVRESKRAYQGRLIRCLDLASIKVAVQGQGTFKGILAHMLKICPWDGIFVENVRHERLHKHMTGLLKDPNWHVYGQEQESFLWVKPAV